MNKQRASKHDGIFDVHPNLNKGRISVLRTTSPRYGRLECYCDSLVAFDVRFKIRKAGYKETIEKKVKNVHAFMRGDTILHAKLSEHVNDDFVLIRYNPYVMDNFFIHDTMEPVNCADVVALEGKKMLALNPRYE